MVTATAAAYGTTVPTVLAHHGPDVAAGDVDHRGHGAEDEADRLERRRADSAAVAVHAGGDLGEAGQVERRQRCGGLGATGELRGVISMEVVFRRPAADGWTRASWEEGSGERQPERVGRRRLLGGRGTCADVDAGSPAVAC